MTDILAALIPPFLLVMLGWGLRRIRFVPDSFWPPAEKLTYYVTFPALLISNIGEAPLAGVPVAPLVAAVMGAMLAVTAAVIALRPRLKIDGPTFTSVLQGSIRPNSYVGLGVAAALYKGGGVTLMALCLAATVPVLNLISVAAMLRWASSRRDGLRAMIRPVVTNPLIIACLIGIAVNLAGTGFPLGVGGFLKALGAASLPIGLLAVGAGLDLGALRGSGTGLGLASALKLAALPLAAAGLAMVFGLSGEPLAVAALYGALPCASSAYVLARQMGGDAALMANIITLETILAALTLPLVLLAFG